MEDRPQRALGALWARAGPSGVRRFVVVVVVVMVVVMVVVAVEVLLLLLPVVLGLVEAMVVDVVVVVDDFLPANPSKALCLMAVVYRTAATFQYMLYLQLCEEVSLLPSSGH
ncbi:unnamed protein product [Gadus morhua 'NCC']